MPPTPPVLSTARLTLRPHAVTDFADSAALWGDPVVVRYIGKPSTREEVWARILRYAGHWSLLGFGSWVVCETATSRFAGEVGLADFRRDIDPSLDGAPEAGWALAPWSHGKGFATEAVRAVLAWAETELSVARTVCMIDPPNVASLRVAAKCGYREWTRAKYRGQEVILFERTASPSEARLGLHP